MAYFKGTPILYGILNSQGGPNKGNMFFGAIPHPVTVTTRITTFWYGSPCEPSLSPATRWSVDPRYRPSSLLRGSGYLVSG